MGLADGPATASPATPLALRKLPLRKLALRLPLRGSAPPVEGPVMALRALALRELALPRLADESSAVTEGGEGERRGEALELG